MKRIAVIGPPGAGKSTLATKLGRIMGIKVWHLDAFFWKPGWVETPRLELAKSVEALVKGEAWVIDGNYSNTFDLRFNTADTIIFLDLSRFTCLTSVISRFFKNIGRTRPDMGAGCKEKLDWGFIKWIWDFEKNKRPPLIEKLSQYENTKNIIILKTRAEVNRFLEKVCASV